jgi:hypothetical protein
VLQSLDHSRRGKLTPFASLQVLPLSLLYFSHSDAIILSICVILLLFGTLASLVYFGANLRLIMEALLDSGCFYAISNRRAYIFYRSSACQIRSSSIASYEGKQIGHISCQITPNDGRGSIFFCEETLLRSLRQRYFCCLPKAFDRGGFIGIRRPQHVQRLLVHLKLDRSAEIHNTLETESIRLTSLRKFHWLPDEVQQVIANECQDETLCYIHVPVASSIHGFFRWNTLLNIAHFASLSRLWFLFLPCFAPALHWTYMLARQRTVYVVTSRRVCIFSLGRYRLFSLHPTVVSFYLSDLKHVKFRVCKWDSASGQDIHLVLQAGDEIEFDQLDGAHGDVVLGSYESNLDYGLGSIMSGISTFEVGLFGLDDIDVVLKLLLPMVAQHVRVRPMIARAFYSSQASSLRALSALRNNDHRASSISSGLDATLPIQGEADPALLDQAAGYYAAFPTYELPLALDDDEVAPEDDLRLTAPQDIAIGDSRAALPVNGSSIDVVGAVLGVDMATLYQHQGSQESQAVVDHFAVSS